MDERSIGRALPPWTGRMWVQAVRPFSLTASVVPVLLGTAVAVTQGPFTPGLFLLTLLGAVAIQGAANLFSDYFDYRGGYELSILRERRRARSRHPPAQSVHRAFGLLLVIGVLLPVA